MTTDDMLRERIAKLEVQVAHLAGKVDEQTEILKRLDSAFDQAKGAKWIILGLASFAGFLAGKGATLMSWLGSAPR